MHRAYWSQYLEAWLNADAKRLCEPLSILEDLIDVYWIVDPLFRGTVLNR